MKTLLHTITSAVSFKFGNFPIRNCLRVLGAVPGIGIHLSLGKKTRFGIRKLPYHLLLANIMLHFCDTIEGIERFHGISIFRKRRKPSLLFNPHCLTPKHLAATLGFLSLNRIVQFRSYIIRLFFFKSLFIFGFAGSFLLFAGCLWLW